MDGIRAFRTRSASVLAVMTLTLAACIPSTGPMSQADQEALLPHATINGASGAWTLGCWMFPPDAFGSAMAMCDGGGGVPHALPNDRPLILSLTSPAKLAPPTTLHAVIGGVTGGSPLAFELALAADGSIGDLPEGPWTYLLIDARYPNGDISWSWSIPPGGGELSSCTTEFASAAALAFRYLAAHDTPNPSPTEQTDTFEIVHPDRLMSEDDLDRALRACTMSEWETGWRTFFPAGVGGLDAIGFARSRCARDELQAENLCLGAGVSSAN